MSINNGHTPLPNSFITMINSLDLTHREYRLMMTIGTEIYRFPEGRESLSKKLAGRYLQSLTGIKQNHISRMLNKFHSRGYIKMIKSHIKGQGSIIILTLDTATVSNNSDTAIVSNQVKLDTPTVSNQVKLDTPTVSNQVKLDTATVSNPINLSIKDHQESDLTDSSINIDQKEEKQPERKKIESSLNSNSLIKDRLTSSKESNLNMPAINLLCPAGAAGNGEFTALGTVLANVIPNGTSILSPEKSSSTPVTVISIPVINKGKEILQSKGFNASTIQSITERIINGIKKNSPEKPVPYFITACNNEKIKTASEFVTSSTGPQVPPVVRPVPAQCAAPSVEKTRKSVDEFWKEERNSISAEEVLTKLSKTCLDKLCTVITEVNNNEKIQKGLSFMMEGEAKKLALENIILTEFKKKYPDIVI